MTSRTFRLSFNKKLDIFMDYLKHCLSLFSLDVVKIENNLHGREAQSTAWGGGA